MRSGGLLSAVLACGSAAAPACAAWPEKPITITVGFGAGGTTDVAARVVGEVLSRQLGQQVIIENKAGAGGAVAATQLMKAAPDGYSLVANTSTTMTFDPHATQLAFGVDDFTYIAAIGEFPEAYIALPDKGWKTLADALAAGKEAGSTMPRPRRSTAWSRRSSPRSRAPSSRPCRRAAAPRP